MNRPLEPDAVPLWTDERGDMRVAGTRILFDVLIDLHQQGAGPEEIVCGYPALTLADVYAVLAYYYRHREQLDQYLHEREEQARKVRADIEARQGPLPAELQARMEALNAARNPSGAAPAV
jgi:uncharacterized protein (DUF433 family)